MESLGLKLQPDYPQTESGYTARLIMVLWPAYAHKSL